MGEGGKGEGGWWQSSKEGKKKKKKRKKERYCVYFVSSLTIQKTFVICVWGKMSILERVLPGTYTSVGKID